MNIILKPLHFPLHPSGMKVIYWFMYLLRDKIFPYWSSPPPWPRTHKGEILKLKRWLKKRGEWLGTRIK